MTELPAVTVSEHDGVRYLHLDSPWVQGAMRIASPRWVELEYVQRMLAWLLWRPSEALGEGHAVQLGLGAGTVTRFCRQLGLRCTAVELNPGVIRAGRQWFRLPHDDDRLEIVNDDAQAWLEHAAAQSAQVLCVDLYDHEAAAPVLDSEPFYALCRGLLAHGGVMSVNLFGRRASFAASAARIVRVFGATQVWRLRPTREGNTVVIAARGVTVPDRETLLARAAFIERHYGAFGLPARKWLRMVQPWSP